jgi:Limiting CO2-inducible proteins B/C beta carbonyic anhydrases
VSGLVVYGPHVGVDYQGNVGTVNRRGKEKGGTCCGSAVAAAGYVKGVYKGEIKEATTPMESMDAQQLYVSSRLLPYAERLDKATNSMIELPYCMFEPLDDLTQKIVAKAAAKVGEKGKIALLGGLQINTPGSISDYFLPLRFEVRDSNDALVENLMYERRF